MAAKVDDGGLLGVAGTAFNLELVDAVLVVALQGGQSGRGRVLCLRWDGRDAVETRRT